MKTAILIKRVNGFIGRAHLFELRPPLAKNTYVVASSTVALFSGPETYLFSAKKSGEVKSWSELEGSQRGTLNYKDCFSSIGYEVKFKK